jgi:hypothetical protein
MHTLNCYTCFNLFDVNSAWFLDRREILKAGRLLLQ